MTLTKRKYYKNVLLLVAMSCSFLSCKSFIGIKTKVDREKSEVKTKNIELEKDKNLIINEFKYKTIDSTLNLFKNEILIEIHLEGYVENDVKEVFLKNIQILTIRNNNEQEIQLIPVFQQRKKRSDNSEYYAGEGGVYNFSTDLQIKISKFYFGKNYIKLKANDKYIEFDLFRPK